MTAHASLRWKAALGARVSSRGVSPPSTPPQRSATQMFTKGHDRRDNGERSGVSRDGGTHGSTATAADPAGMPLFFPARLWHSWWTAPLAMP